MSYFIENESERYTTFDRKINSGHSDLYSMVQWFLFFYFFALKNILVLMAKPDSGKLRFLRQLLLYGHALEIHPDYVFHVNGSAAAVIIL